jgi:hypothetical protein
MVAFGITCQMSQTGRKQNTEPSLSICPAIDVGVHYRNPSSGFEASGRPFGFRRNRNLNMAHGQICTPPVLVHEQIDNASLACQRFLEAPHLTLLQKDWTMISERGLHERQGAPPGIQRPNPPRSSPT